MKSIIAAKLLDFIPLMKIRGWGCGWVFSSFLKRGLQAERINLWALMLHRPGWHQQSRCHSSVLQRSLALGPGNNSISSTASHPSYWIVFNMTLTTSLHAGTTCDLSSNADLIQNLVCGISWKGTEGGLAKVVQKWMLNNDNKVVSHVKC